MRSGARHPEAPGRTIALVNARRVPAALQETLLSGVNQLVAQSPVCVPRVAPVAAEPAQPATTAADAVTRRAKHQRQAPRPRRGRLSTYRVDRELGRGGMAVVYAGWHEQLDRPVALKVLASHLAGDEHFRARFLREARIASKLHHPNLVRTYDIAELDGSPCIVMELLPGGTLEGRSSRALQPPRSPPASRTRMPRASSTAT